MPSVSNCITVHDLDGAVVDWAQQFGECYVRHLFDDDGIGDDSKNAVECLYAQLRVAARAGDSVQMKTLAWQIPLQDDPTGGSSA